MILRRSGTGELIARPLLAKGATGSLFFTTEDAQGEYEDLSGRGVEFIQKPEQRPYGVDAGFRDSSGNHIRMVQGNG